MEVSPWDVQRVHPEESLRTQHLLWGKKGSAHQSCACGAKCGVHGDAAAPAPTRPGGGWGSWALLRGTCMNAGARILGHLDAAFHWLVGYLKDRTLNLIVIWLRLTLLSSPGAVWDSLQLEEKGGSLQMAFPFSISDAFSEWDALSLSTPWHPSQNANLGLPVMLPQKFSF